MNSRPVFVALLCVLLFASGAAAQAETNCPRIDVTGPAGIARSGEFIRFTASVRGGNDSLQPTYAWTISSGKIVSGQGTKSIVVDNEDRAITATVDIGGLPAECPKSTSENYGGDPPPTAEKFLQLERHQSVDDRTKSLIVSVLNAHPSDALYVLETELLNNDLGWLQSQELYLRVMLDRNDIPRSRLTIKRVAWKSERIQFWRVPPGAENPVCRECEEWRQLIKDCPDISVVGPAGVVLPGEPMTFTAHVNPDSPLLRFKWQVTDSVIIGGQGTRVLRARYLPKALGANVFATVTVDGLPSVCPSTATGTHPVEILLAPIQIGSVSNSSYTIHNSLLRRIENEMSSQPSSQLYVWIYVGQNERQSENLKARILRQLRTTKIDPSRFTLRVSTAESRGIIFWRVPPGSENPAP